MKVLMLCLGNICRSPMAEGVLRSRAAARGIDVHVDSAGTGGWHAGDPPDPRAIAAALGRGVDLAALRARKLERADFQRFDIILAMDSDNLAQARALAPARGGAKVVRFLDHAGIGGDVPDPYYSGRFDAVLDLIERGCDATLEQMPRP
jgi:protein-tyrosine phosphatase